MCLCFKTVWSIASLCMASLASAATVHVVGGELAGATNEDVDSFKGVPYALPPVGALRWSVPQPAPAWGGTRSALRYAPACIQGGSPWPPGTPTETQSEDCLYLNIWRPADAQSGARLPVMVWIPGGGWTDGSGSAPLYDGSRLARRGVIVVTINYRVGAFGFLAHEALSRESPHASSGNYGLRDQVAALRWVHDNIDAFGGDATRVTIFGQSAGSMSANLLTVSPPARGLFQRVIGQSGAVFVPVAMAGDTFLLQGAQAEGARFAAALNAPTIEALRRVPAGDILEAQRRFNFHFIVDNEMLPEEPWAAYSAGRQAPIDLLVGWNADEGQWFIAGETLTAATLDSGISQEIGQFPEPLRPWYRAATDAQARSARAAFESDLRMRYDTWTWMRLQARTGKGKVFAYRFEQVPPATAGSPFIGMGATHGTEIPYVFDTLAIQGWAGHLSDRRLAATMADYWSNFAKTGDPNGNGLPRWPRYVPAAPGQPPQVLDLGDTIRASPQTDVDALQAMDVLFKAMRSQDSSAPPRR